MTNDQRQVFRELHSGGCFVIPNPWDQGSARLLATLGFRALATTSAGFAWSTGRADNAVPRDDVLEHLRLVAAAVSVPVNADFEGGFAVDPGGVATNVALAAATGIAGLSIEDSSGDPEHPLFDFDHSVERVRAARVAINEHGPGIVLTGRSEGFICGRPDLSATIDRLCAYADAGADCLYAPGLGSIDDVSTVVRALAPKPVNVLITRAFTDCAQLEQAGVRRISVGGALARVAWAAFHDAARELSGPGTFSFLAQPRLDLDAVFSGERTIR
ncbi:MAG: isocitrate lyase/PEP mutase family protein [Gemmatimonadota bacterium]